MTSLADIFAPIADDLKRFDSHFSDIMSSDVKLVDQVARYIVKHKGKRFRPALVIVSARAVGEPRRDTFTTASVVELLHTASLVHDDVLDEAELRRGFPTIHKVWKNKVAVLMGDYLLAKSLIAATETGSLAIMNTVATVAKRLIKGEIFEIQKARNLDITESEYFRLIADKTASLISACCELGALTVKATDEERKALRDFGENLGIAFQIKDDLLDYESSSGVLGKPALADVEDKKITLPLLYAFAAAGEGERKRVIRMMRRGAKRRESRLILSFVEQHGGIERARGKALEVKDQAIRALAPLPESPARSSLIELSEFVVSRKK